MFIGDNIQNRDRYNAQKWKEKHLKTKWDRFWYYAIQLIVVSLLLSGIIYKLEKTRSADDFEPASPCQGTFYDC